MAPSRRLAELSELHSRNSLADRATNVNKLPVYCCSSEIRRLPEDDSAIIAVDNVQAGLTRDF